MIDQGFKQTPLPDVPLGLFSAPRYAVPGKAARVFAVVCPREFADP